MGFIYKITNQVTAKCYVGQTSKTIEARFSEHLYNARKGRKSNLYNSIRKHGPGVFIVEMLEECDNSLLCKREKHWIKMIGCRYPTGYNSTDGGVGGDVSHEQFWIDGMKRRRSYVGEGNPMYGKRGDDNPNFGVKRSQEVVDNIKRSIKASWDSDPERREAQRQRFKNNNPMKGRAPPNAIPISFEGKLYPSLAAACRDTGHSSKYLKRNKDG